MGCAVRFPFPSYCVRRCIVLLFPARKTTYLPTHGDNVIVARPTRHSAPRFVLLNHFHPSCCLTWRVHRAPFHRQCLVFVVSPQCLSVCLEAPAAAFITLFLTRHCHRRNCYLFCASVCCCHSHTNSPQCSSTALLFGCRRRRRLPGRLTCLLCVCCLFLT